MAAVNSVFQRKEKKYHLDARQYQMMLQALSGRMEIDEYGATTIISTYYDTPDWHLIDRSLEKPLYKEKLRVRRYDGLCSGAQANPSPDSTVFIEIKKKFKGIVYKRRIPMSFAGARAFLAGMPYEQACGQFPLADSELQRASFDYRSWQIAREVDAFMQRNAPLAPSMDIRVVRTAYRMIGIDGENVIRDETSALSGQGELRITFDCDCRYRNLAAAHAAEQPLIDQNDAVMEIKSVGPYPLWLVEALNRVQAYPESFSKYGRAYCACTAGRMVKTSTCSSYAGAMGGNTAFPTGNLAVSSEVPASMTGDASASRDNPNTSVRNTIVSRFKKEKKSA